MAEQSTHHREAFTYLMQQAPILFFTLSRQGKILRSNSHANTFTGRKLEGEDFQDVIIDFNGTFDLAASVQKTGTEQLINIANASRLPQSFYFTFMPVADRILAFGRLDAGDLENMRIEILSLNNDLSNLTRELHKKNAQLQLLNAEKNQFLGMAAHDLRSPIGTIRTYTEFVLDEAQNLLDEEQIDFLKTIHTNSRFMQRLVDDFLDVSAIEAGKFDLDLAPATLGEVLSRSLTFNTLQANKKDIEIKVISDDQQPSVAMDAPKVQQAMTNLVSNAIEHSKPGSVVTIQLSANAQYIHFSVKDTGMGIPVDKMDNLFKPFGKTGTKKTAGEKSTGLGMLITRKIIESHAGRIWVDSQTGKGTTVHFNLPMKEG